METDLKIDMSAFDAAVSRALTETKREPVAYMREQAKGVVRRIIEITPPAHDGINGSAARQHGAAVVKGDIAKIYGRPSDAYAMMKEMAPSESMAKGFWRHYTQGEFERAKDLFRAATGESFGEFDDGKLHSSRRGSRGRVSGIRSGKPLMWTWNPKALTEYVKKKQDMPGWLAGGWNFAAAMLNFRAPAWISRHASPGAGNLIVNDEGVRIRMVNKVGYAGEVDGWRRRIQWALNTQAEAIRRRSEQFVKNMFSKKGFKVAA